LASLSGDASCADVPLPRRARAPVALHAMMFVTVIGIAPPSNVEYDDTAARPASFVDVRVLAVV
jgi:hypothetical protein